MELQWVDPSDEALVAESLDLINAVNAVDEPWEPPSLFRPYAGELRVGWDGEPPLEYVYRPDGRVVGKLSLEFPERDNLHAVFLSVQVRPGHRRRGLGRALFEAGRERARAAGRRLLLTHALDAPAPNAFCRALGFERASVDIERRQHVTQTDWTEIERLRARAEHKADGYSLLWFDGPVPDEMLEAVATMSAAINDAPTDDFDIEDDAIDAERVRAFEDAIAAWGRRWYRVVARRDADGALAGHTMVAVDPERPTFGFQYDTSVVREHRGHRLGRLLKASMLQWLREREPEMRWIDTGNAESNTHMIEVNEQLGYQVIARHIGWQRAV